MAKINYKKKPKNPRLCELLMTEFLQDAATLVDDNGTPLYIHLTKSNGFYSFINDDEIRISYNYSELASPDPADIEFARNFHLRAPFSVGFSDLTLSLLHELGHFETESNLPTYYNRDECLAQIDRWETKDKRVIQLLYCSLPDEYLATQWAINWLADPENRKKAKKFEKKFFKAWRGEK